MVKNSIFEFPTFRYLVASVLLPEEQIRSFQKAYFKTFFLKYVPLQNSKICSGCNWIHQMRCVRGETLLNHGSSDMQLWNYGAIFSPFSTSFLDCLFYASLSCVRMELKSITKCFVQKVIKAIIIISLLPLPTYCKSLWKSFNFESVLFKA